MSQARFFTNTCVLHVFLYIHALDFLNSPGVCSILILSNRKTGSSAGEPFTPCPHLESSPWSRSFLVSPETAVPVPTVCGLASSLEPHSHVCPSMWSQDVPLNQWRFPLEHFSSWRPHHPVSPASNALQSCPPPRQTCIPHMPQTAPCL